MALWEGSWVGWKLPSYSTPAMHIQENMITVCVNLAQDPERSAARDCHLTTYSSCSKLSWRERGSGHQIHDHCSSAVWPSSPCSSSTVTVDFASWGETQRREVSITNLRPHHCSWLGGCNWVQFSPPLLSIVNSLHPQLVLLQVLETYLEMWLRPHYCEVWACLSLARAVVRLLLQYSWVMEY